MKIIYAKEVRVYLWELIEMLYFKEYFGFKDLARKYVIELVTDIAATIHIRQKHKAPPYFSRYGNDLYYITFPKNKHTTWYFFFTHHPADNIYYIRYITNNHVAGHLLK
ncbi:MAG: hypothetical protein LUH22_17875 [Bacteroides sp.]|nr:hypothetical protein [Bacteroides sp.]